MEYSVNGLAKLAGVTPRTIRHYDEIDLLKPARINSSGYRIYGSLQVDLLQQIMFYRELGFELDKIKEIIQNPNFDKQSALQIHQGNLIKKRDRLNALIATVEKTILSAERNIDMSDSEKFEGFKNRLIEENEEKYGDEIREKYGDDTIDQSNKRFRNMTKEQFDEMTKLGEDLIDEFVKAFGENDPSGETAQNAADMHRRWLSYSWDSYSPEAHRGLVQMYVDDPRFAAYYDKHQEGLSKFVRDAVNIYADNRK